jgi:hypothetical protein
MEELTASAEPNSLYNEICLITLSLFPSNIEITSFSISSLIP